MVDVILRAWTLDDAPALAAAINNKKVHDNLRDGIPFPYSENDAVEYISGTLAKDKNDNFVRAIVYDGNIVGNIGVYRRQNVHRLTAEVGYFLAEAYWGKGIMAQAVRLMCAYVFEHSDIVRIDADPYAYNHASCRVLEKAGFQYEGTLRRNAVKNGVVLDMKMYSILRGDVS